LSEARNLLKSLSLTPNEGLRQGLLMNRDGVRRTGFDLLTTREWHELEAIWPQLRAIGAGVAARLQTEARYAVYLERQQADARLLRAEDARSIPEGANFDDVPGLSREIRQKLLQRRPRTLAEAQRIDGMTPAALAIVLAHLRRI